ncbi:MAG TPA: hypothetical protein DEQ40_09120 [Oxalobacteraceae bacterium]|jgi:hypothetical protein|nr:hypothetical protein [Oxalobacteraceae bacterium]
MLVGQRYTLKHGHARDFKVTREYRSWDAMKSRCLRPSHKSYANYGGCGIRVCSRWLNSFKDFFADMGPRPKGTTLDRERPDGNYTPKNCRWANPKIQSNNKRKKRTKHGKAKQ